MNPWPGNRDAPRVLIVDHGTTVLSSVVQIVQDLGYDVQVCASTTAIIVAQGFQPEVALFDLGMPGPYTCELLTAFRTDLPHIPVVIIGLAVDPRIIEHLLNKEAFAYISKPFTPGDISDILRAALRGDA